MPFAILAIVNVPVPAKIINPIRFLDKRSNSNSGIAIGHKDTKVHKERKNINTVEQLSKNNNVPQSNSAISIG